jgi:hypothetical protein
MKVKTGMLQSGVVLVGLLDEEKQELNKVYQAMATTTDDTGDQFQVVLIPPCGVFGSGPANKVKLDIFCVLQDGNEDVVQLYKQMESPLTLPKERKIRLVKP